MGTRGLSATAVAGLTALTMLAFAGNSLLCRLALQQTGIDAASFTTLRLASGAAVLGLLVCWRVGGAGGVAVGGGSWGSALALFAYAACFSWAYRSLSAATGALLLFGAVQATMIGRGLWAGERLRRAQTAGLLLALAGLGVLLMPGLAAPPLGGSALMLAAGVAWGVYSLRGRGAGDPTATTAGNFLRAAPMALGLSVLTWPEARLDAAGAAYALASGALASGLGYALWYAVLPALKTTQAATVQLSVPVITALGGVAWLGETLSLRLALSAAAVLGGIWLVSAAPKPVADPAGR